MLKGVRKIVKLLSTSQTIRYILGYYIVHDYSKLAMLFKVPKLSTLITVLM